MVSKSFLHIPWWLFLAPPTRFPWFPIWNVQPSSWFWIPHVNAHVVASFGFNIMIVCWRRLKMTRRLFCPLFFTNRGSYFSLVPAIPKFPPSWLIFLWAFKINVANLGASILEAGIPFLGSLSMMSKLGFILDIPNNRVAISALACEVQLVNLDGNMAIDITQFPKAPLIESRVAESMLIDKEVNFLFQWVSISWCSVATSWFAISLSKIYHQSLSSD